jgi:Superfamily II DNA/RNA helicase required for DNA uptake (late competence protein)
VVLNADDERIFDDNTLVQMAGRAGRTTKNPQGKVWFVCKKDNVHIRDAVKQIKDMNDYALEKGYIS